MLEDVVVTIPGITSFKPRVEKQFVSRAEADFEHYCTMLDGSRKKIN